MRLAIHQPNFLPWLPYFDKMKSADVFVVLTHCQWTKNKYQHRFRLNDRWYTMSVNHGLQPIAEKHYATCEKDWARIKRQLSQYAKVLAQFDSYVSPSLMLTNIQIIEKIAQVLGIDTRIVLDFETGLTGTDRLVRLCQFYGADTYLAGASGAHYMELEKFGQAGIKVEFQDLAKIDTRHTLEVLQ